MELLKEDKSVYQKLIVAGKQIKQNPTALPLCNKML